MSAGLYLTGGCPSSFLHILALVASLASQPVSGRVLAPDGLPVAGALIAVVGGRESVRTDSEGRFVWDPAPALPALVTIVLPDGRVAGPMTLNAGPDESTLVAGPTVAETIVVAGVAPGIDTLPAASRTLLTSADLQLRQPLTLSQAADVVPGVSTISEGQGAVPAIRGLARGRTILVVDGSRADAERRAGANAAFLDPALLQRVEVARGPGSVAYGSDALGGVIAAQTRPAPLDRGAHARGSLTGGWGVPLRRADLEVGLGYDDGGVALGVRLRDLDDYDSPSGEVANSQWRDGGLRGRWDHLGAVRTWSAAWQSDWARDIGRPRSDSDAVRVSAPRDDSHRLNVTHTSAGLAGLRNLRLQAMAGRSRQQTDQDRLPTTARARSLEQADVSATDGQLRVTADRGLGGLRLHGGIEARGRYGLRALDTVVAYNLTGAEVSRTTQVSIDDAHRTDAGLFVEADAPVAGRLRLTSGIRADRVVSRNSGGYFGSQTVAHSAVSGVVAATLAATGRLTVTAQLARGFRDPLLSDRFYRGPVGRGFIEGNPDLRPETSLQADVTAYFRAGPVQLSAAAYRYRISDLIERYAETAVLFRYRNRSRAVLRGLEVEAQAGLPRGFAMSASVEASKGADPDTGAAIDDIAPPAAALALHHAAGDRWTASIRVEATARHRRAGPSEVPTVGYTMLDVGARRRLADRIWAVGAARNLLNDAYQSSAGPRWVWAPGRQATAGIVVEF